MNAKNQHTFNENEQQLYNVNFSDSLLIVKSSVLCMKTVMLKARNDNQSSENNEYLDILNEEVEIISSEYDKLEHLVDLQAKRAKG